MSRKQWIGFGLASTIVSAGLIAWGLTARWNAGISLAVAGIALSVAGFTIAIQQIRTTRNASLAAALAVKSTIATIASLRISALLPTLRHDLEALESAMTGDDADAAGRALNRLRTASLEAANALSSRVQDGHVALKQVAKARSVALEAKTELYTSGDPSKTVVNAYEEMERACDELTTASSDLLPRETRHE